MNVAVPQASIVSKSQYALLKNVTPGRVSQWIAENKIEADALIGEGRGAKIDVRKADAYLRKNLDISQRFGNGLSTRLNEQQSAAAAQTPELKSEELSPTIAPAAPVDPIEEQIKREKLEGLQRENRKRAEDEAARAGRYTLSDDSAKQMAKIATQMLAIQEGSLSEIAASIAAKFQIQQRDVLHLLRTEFRAMRVRSASALKETAATLPATFEDEIEPIEPETTD